MLEHRHVSREDFITIAAFPQNQEELFFMYPRGHYPITPEQLAEAAESRCSPTVVTRSAEVVAYGNLYDMKAGEQCWIGNVMVSPSHRRSGAGSFLIRTLIRRASEEHQVKCVHLICHNTNTKALLFYFNLGFRPYGIKPMQDYKQQLIAGIQMKLEI